MNEWRKDKNPGRSIAIALIAVALACIAMYFWIRSDTEDVQASVPAGPNVEPVTGLHPNRTPIDVLLVAFAEDVREGRLDAAYARTASAYRAGVPAETFAARAPAALYLPSITGVSIQRTRQTGGSMRAEGLAVAAGSELDLVASLTREGGEWRIAGLNIAGTPVLPVP